MTSTNIIKSKNHGLKIVRIILIKVTELLFPKRCIGCGIFGVNLCYQCASEIELIRTSTCPECGKLTLRYQFCDKCRKRQALSLRAIIVAAHYKSPHIKEMIYELKYNGITGLSDTLGELLYQSAKNINSGKNPIITAVPLSRRKEKTRGFNQSKMIAEKAGKRLCIPYLDLLQRRLNTKPQSGLRRTARIENVHNAFSFSRENPDISGRSIFLVDDITTTHATLNECAKVLKENGAREVIGLVVAKNI